MPMPVDTTEEAIGVVSAAVESKLLERLPNTTNIEFLSYQECGGSGWSQCGFVVCHTDAYSAIDNTAEIIAGSIILAAQTNGATQIQLSELSVRNNFLCGSCGGTSAISTVLFIK